MQQTKKTINIHGKEYLPVHERVLMAHQAEDKISITTELVPNTNGSVVIKATIVTNKGTFTGYSAANPAKLIEKMSPYEVAETSAVGRALGFAGYGIIDGIATADEIHKAQVPEEEGVVDEVPLPTEPDEIDKQLNEADYICKFCGRKATRRTGVAKSGKAWVGYFCESGNEKHTTWE